MGSSWEKKQTLFLEILCGFFITFISFSLTGCLNTGANGLSTAASKVASNSSSATTTASANFITISKVVRSNLNPDTTIELIGSNGQLATYCPTADACQCQFDFTESGGVPAQRFQALSYVEVNMARCLYTQVSSNAGYYDVSIFINSANANSNKTRVFMNSISPSLDPSVAANYVETSRYMCRDVIRKSRSATNFYGQNLQDPKAWLLSQAYNFYTTSLGLDYGAHAVAIGESVENTPGFECPPVPNDSTFDASIRYEVYSVDPLSFSDYGGSATNDNTIYPPDDKVGIDPDCPTGTEADCEKFLVNRHDFALAKFQDGTFKQPVCTLHTPANMVNPSLSCTTTGISAPVTLAKTTASSVGKDIIGFAALPNANQECPNTSVVNLPAGKKWAKLWRFRASLEKRTMESASNSGQIGYLYCTTQNQECSEPTADQNSACWDADPQGSGTTPGIIGPRPMVPSGAGGTYFGNCSTSGVIGDNWAPGGGYLNAGNACSSAAVQAVNGGGSCCYDYGATGAGRVAANYTQGGNYCTPGLTGLWDLPAIGGENVWLMGSNSTACIEADTDAAGRLFFNGIIGPDPYRRSSIDIDASSTFDYLYVVTPASVRMEDMTDPNSTSARKFKPYRKDRNNNNIHYGISLGSENTATQFERLVKFPLCVLQDSE